MDKRWIQFITMYQILHSQHDQLPAGINNVSFFVSIGIPTKTIDSESEECLLLRIYRRPIQET